MVSIADAAAALHPALAADVAACSSSVSKRSAELARLRAIIESAPERLAAVRSAVAAYFDGLIAGLLAGKEAALAECDRVSAALVATALEQEQRETGTTNEAQLMADIGNAALASTDPVDVIQAAAAVAATQCAASRPAYPVTECAVEFVPFSVADVRLNLDGSAVVVGRIIATDVDMVRTGARRRYSITRVSKPRAQVHCHTVFRYTLHNACAQNTE